MAKPPADAPVLEEEAVVEPLAAGTNQFVPWVPSLQTNMTAIAAYIADARTASGVVAGVADPLIYNRAVHQGAFVGAAIAQFVANSGVNVMDDGTMSLATFITNLTAALTAPNGSIANIKLANMPLGTVKANITGAPAAPQDVAYAALLTAMGVTIPTQAHYQGNSSSAGSDSMANNNWTQRILNWADPANNIAGAGLAGNRVTLPVGRYSVIARANAEATAAGVGPGFRHQVRVRNVTGGVTVGVGVNATHPGSAGEEGAAISSCASLFTLGAISQIEIDSFVVTPGGTTGVANGGDPMGSGEYDVWTDALFAKVA